MGQPILFGATYSVYVRAARLTLEEKGVAYTLQEVDIFAPGGPPAEYLERQPFGRIPAFEHDGFTLFETAAINRYVDEAFDGPALLPETPQGRACAAQIVGILDNYAYRTWVWDIFVERNRKQEMGGESDEKIIAAALPLAATCLDTIEGLMAGQSYMLMDSPSLADLHAAPMIDLLQRVPEGESLLAARPRWAAWWEQMSARPSMTVTGLQPRLASTK